MTINSELHNLGSVQTFGPITMTPRPSGRWAVTWTVEWEFGELLDAFEQVATLTGIVRSTAQYRVAVKISPERQPRAKKAQP